MRVLFVASRFPYPPIQGDRVRAYHHLRLLSRRHQVVLLTPEPEENRENNLNAIRPFCRQIEVVPTASLRRLWRLGQTRESLMTTLKLAKELDPDTAQFYPIMIYPGTEAYRWAQENGYLTTNDFSEWLTEDGLHNTIVSRPGLSARELVEFCDYARQQFYLRPRYVLSKGWEIVTHPREGKRFLKSFRTFAKYLFRGTFGPRSSFAKTPQRQE